MRQEIARGRASRAVAIKETLASLPQPNYEAHSQIHKDVHYISRLKPWHHRLMLGLLAGDKSQAQLAEELGHSESRVSLVINSPLFQQVYQAILAKRLESVVEGEHGVVAQARAEAPQATVRLVALSKHAKSDGVKLDAIKHILALAGAAPVIRTETYSLDKMIEAMDRRELEVFRDTGKVPRRFAEMLAQMGRNLPFSDESESIDVTPTIPRVDNSPPDDENDDA